MSEKYRHESLINWKGHGQNCAYCRPAYSKWARASEPCLSGKREKVGPLQKIPRRDLR